MVTTTSCFHSVITLWHIAGITPSQLFINLSMLKENQGQHVGHLGKVAVVGTLKSVFLCPGNHRITRHKVQEQDKRTTWSSQMRRLDCTFISSLVLLSDVVISVSYSCSLETLKANSQPHFFLGQYITHNHLIYSLFSLLLFVFLLFCTTTPRYSLVSGLTKNNNKKSSLP